MAAVTIRDVARAAEVSVATVSRALNGIATVDPELVERVTAAAARLGYVPNSVGRSLRLQQSNTWAVVVLSLNAFITSVVQAIENAAQREGTSVYLGITGLDPERERSYVRAAVSQRVSGLIVASMTSAASFADVELPIVFVDRPNPGGRHDSVTIDNREVGHLAADHLLDQGFRRVAMIEEGVAGQPVEERAAGFRERLAERGIDLPPERVRQTDLSLEASKAAMLELLDAEQGPDAVFCVNGPSTQGAYFGIQAAGNTSVALMGTDNENWTSLATPSITVVRQPVTRIGQTAARLLIERVAGSTAPVRNEVLQPTLIVRESTHRR